MTEVLDREFTAASGAVADRTFQIEVAVVREEPSGFSVHACNLAGVVSQGETIAEAIENIREAASMALGTYLEDGSIPWTSDDVEGEIVTTKWIMVHAEAPRT